MSFTSLFIIGFFGWCAISWGIALFIARKFFGEKSKVL